MSFGATPVDGSTTPIPMSSVVPDGSTTPVVVEGGPSISSAGNNLAPVSMYIKDGNDVTQGTSTDANTANTIIGRLTKIRDLLNTTLPVTVTNATTLGQAIMVNSSPVVIASDQSSIAVKKSPGNVVVLASGAYTTTQTQADQTNFVLRGIKVALNVTVAGTGSITLFIEGKDTTSATYYTVLTGVAVTTVSFNLYTVYPGLTPVANVTVSDALPATYRIRVLANNANSMTYSVGLSGLI